MAKNIEINVKTANGYELLYPAVNPDILKIDSSNVQVDNTLSEKLGLNDGANMSDVLGKLESGVYCTSEEKEDNTIYDISDKLKENNLTNFWNYYSKFHDGYLYSFYAMSNDSKTYMILHCIRVNLENFNYEDKQYNLSNMSVLSGKKNLDFLINDNQIVIFLDMKSGGQIAYSIDGGENYSIAILPKKSGSLIAYAKNYCYYDNKYIWVTNLGYFYALDTDLTNWMWDSNTMLYRSCLTVLNNELYALTSSNYICKYDKENNSWTTIWSKVELNSLESNNELLIGKTSHSCFVSFDAINFKLLTFVSNYSIYTINQIIYDGEILITSIGTNTSVCLKLKYKITKESFTTGSDFFDIISIEGQKFSGGRSGYNVFYDNKNNKVYFCGNTIVHYLNSNNISDTLLINTLKEKLNLNNLKFETGIYIGNGTYDEINSIVLNFKFQPSLVIIYGVNVQTDSSLFLNGQFYQGAIVLCKNGVGDQITYSTLFSDNNYFQAKLAGIVFIDNYVRFYSTTSAIAHLNVNKYKYYYIGIG